MANIAANSANSAASSAEQQRHGGTDFCKMNSRKNLENQRGLNLWDENSRREAEQSDQERASAVINDHFLDLTAPDIQNVCAKLSVNVDETTALQGLSELQALLLVDGNLATALVKGGEAAKIEQLQFHESDLVYEQAASLLLSFFGGRYED
jgi:hypothetical protein